MYCQSCGQEMKPGVVSCSSCGAKQEGGSVSGGAIFLRHAAATVWASLCKLELGEQIVVGGAGVAALSFFLPWLSIDVNVGELAKLLSGTGYSGSGSFSLSGFGLLKYWGAVVILLLLPLTSGFLVFWARSRGARSKITLGSVHVAIGSLMGPYLLADLLLLPMAGKIVGVGLLGLALGYCGVLAGGVILIRSNAFRLEKASRKGQSPAGPPEVPPITNTGTEDSR